MHLVEQDDHLPLPTHPPGFQADQMASFLHHSGLTDPSFLAAFYEHKATTYSRSLLLSLDLDGTLLDNHAS